MYAYRVRVCGVREGFVLVFLDGVLFLSTLLIIYLIIFKYICMYIWTCMKVESFVVEMEIIIRI